ncbi:MAG: response regulator [Desulfosarcinaceae bacterium]
MADKRRPARIDIGSASLCLRTPRPSPPWGSKQAAARPSNQGGSARPTGAEEILSQGSKDASVDLDREMAVLFVATASDDDPHLRQALAGMAEEGFRLSRVERVSAAIRHLGTVGARLVLLDLGRPASDGLDGIRQLRATFPRVPIVALAGDRDVTIGLAAVKAGSQDCLVKDGISADLLVRASRFAVERYRAQAAFRQKDSEARFRQIFDSSPNCVSIKGHDGRYIMANEALADLFALPAADILGRTDAEIFHLIDLDPQRAADSMSEDRRVLRSGETHKVQEAPFVRPDGSVRWFSTIKTPIVFPGDPHSLLEIASDVSEQHKAREALRNSELRLRTILDALTSSVVHLDLELKVLWPNQAACAWAGMSPSDIIGQPCYRIWFNRKSACRDCPVKVAMAEGTPQLRQKRSADGRTWRILGCPVKDDAGQVVSFVEVAEEISDRLKMEEQLRQAQKMESLGTLAGGIAHDFNNILSAILGYAELALQEARNEAGLADFLKEIYKAGERAKELVRQILTFSRRGDTKLKPLRIELIVKEALKLLRSSLPTTINIVQKIEKELDPILADPTQIHQIIMNLCTNASHAMTPDGGELVVTLAKADLGRETFRRFVDLKPGRYLKLTVSDTGCGMTPEIMAAIFDPYFTTKDLGEGTGLGLAVVHGIVQEYGGDIRVQSEPGKGTTFSIYFPAIKKEASASSKDDADHLPGGDERILVIDDEPAILKVMQRNLSYLGYRVTTQGDSRQALALFTADPTAFDLVLTDMTMPKMTGDRLAKAMLSIRPDIPIALCTGYSRQIDAQQVKADGIRALLMKPVSQKLLASELRHLLDNQPSEEEGHIEGDGLTNENAHEVTASRRL